jgi:hypothetical protein
LKAGDGILSQKHQHAKRVSKRTSILPDAVKFYR